MPEYIRALIAILAMGTAVFYFAKPLFIEFGISNSMFDARRKCWYLITLAAFLSLSFWIFVILLAGVLIYAKKKETAFVSLYFFLLLALPLLKADLPGFGPVRFLIEIDYLRVVAVILLLPLCLQEWRKKTSAINKLFLCDLFYLSYIFLTLLLHFRTEDVIGMMRYVIYDIVDLIIPYYAISRCVNKIEDFKEILANFALTGAIIATIAIFEFARRWLVYTTIGEALNLDGNVFYLDRGEFLRAMVTSGQPIVLGFNLIAVLGSVLYLKSKSVKTIRYAVLLAVVILGEVASLSKGPWVGVALMGTILILTDSKSVKKISYALGAIIVAAVLLTNTEFGSAAIEYLPFVGSLDEGSMSYRQLLLDKSLQAISDHPWFGSLDYLDQMEELRQGQGIIDLVNTYLIVALDSGLVGLALFVGYFLMVLSNVYRSTKSLARGGEHEWLGRILLAILVGLLFVLASCSPITQIPAMYIAFSALALSYHRATGKLKF